MEHLSLFLFDFFSSVAPSVRIIAVFLFALIEGMPILGSLFPGGTIALLVGALSHSGFIAPVFAIVLITVGNFMGDMIGFLVGRTLGHTRWVQKLLYRESHQKHWERFDRHIIPIILLSRILPLVRSLPALFAGARGIPPHKYTLLSFGGAILWAITGIYGGNLIARVAGTMALPIILGILIVSIIVTIVMQYRKNKQQHL